MDLICLLLGAETVIGKFHRVLSAIAKIFTDFAYVDRVWLLGVNNFYVVFRKSNGAYMCCRNNFLQVR